MIRDSEPKPLPRWVQVTAGVVLLPIALLCIVGAGSIFTIPKVQSSPLLQLLALAICVGCLWVVAVCVRLVFGIKRRGLIGPWMMRVIAISALGIVVGGLFTGYYVQRPVIGVIMAISYLLIARRLWVLAARRAHNTHDTSLEHSHER